MITKTQTNTDLLVGNVVLKTNVLKEIEHLQFDDNAEINDKCQACSDLICLLCKNIYLFENKTKNDVMDYLQFLAEVKDDYTRLKV
ncbi:MAG: hypothetical protein NTZ33_14565 [Bacteroidetes bacterium]|nr:hypothetical protein [Bacteroidota bacterium]